MIAPPIERHMARRGRHGWRLTRRDRWVAAASLVMLAGTAIALPVAAWVNRAAAPTGDTPIPVPVVSPSGGDPGGRLLGQLEPVRTVVPSGSHILQADFQEPFIDSCDGNPATAGWNDVVVQIDFTWPGDDTALVSYVAHGLQGLGWRLVESNPLYVQLQRSLSSGADAQVSLDPSGSTYELVAVAPPVGKQASGC